jgi:hypothetical protein
MRASNASPSARAGPVIEELVWQPPEPRGVRQVAARPVETDLGEGQPRLQRALRPTPSPLFPAQALKYVPSSGKAQSIATVTVNRRFMSRSPANRPWTSPADSLIDPGARIKRPAGTRLSFRRRRRTGPPDRRSCPSKNSTTVFSSWIPVRRSSCISARGVAPLKCRVPDGFALDREGHERRVIAEAVFVDAVDQAVADRARISADWVAAFDMDIEFPFIGWLDHEARLSAPRHYWFSRPRSDPGMGLQRETVGHAGDVVRHDPRQRRLVAR